MMSGFSLGNAVNSAADWACSAPVICGIVGNPVYTALLITALAAVVVMALYTSAVQRGGVKRAARAVIYVFLLVTAVTFVHHYAMRREMRSSEQQRGVREVFSGIRENRSLGAGGAFPVLPEQGVVYGAGNVESARPAWPAGVAPASAMATDSWISDVVVPARMAAPV
jgi:hypothetical protein